MEERWSPCKGDCRPNGEKEREKGMRARERWEVVKHEKDKDKERGRERETRRSPRKCTRSEREKKRDGVCMLVIKGATHGARKKVSLTERLISPARYGVPNARRFFAACRRVVPRDSAPAIAAQATRTRSFTGSTRELSVPSVDSEIPGRIRGPGRLTVDARRRGRAVRSRLFWPNLAYVGAFSRQFYCGTHEYRSLEECAKGLKKFVVSNSELIQRIRDSDTRDSAMLTNDR